MNRQSGRRDLKRNQCTWYNQASPFVEHPTGVKNALILSKCIYSVNKVVYIINQLDFNTINSALGMCYLHIAANCYIRLLLRSEQLFSVCKGAGGISIRFFVLVLGANVITICIRQSVFNMQGSNRFA
jgi:hypothetical protein